MVSDDDAQGDLCAFFDAARGPDGALDEIMRVHSLHPAGFRAHDELYRAVMRDSSRLRKVDRELIALVVSRVNECHY